MASVQERTPSPNRPRSVTIVAAGVLLLGLVNIYRAAILYRQIDLQLEFGVTLDPRIRMIAAAFWAIVFLVMAALIWSRQPTTKILVPVLLLIYAIYRLGLVAIFAQSTYIRNIQVIYAVLYGIAISISIWALNRPKGKSYFAQD